eukprot:2463520-Amphidinium_carterae.1
MDIGRLWVRSRHSLSGTRLHTALDLIQSSSSCLAAFTSSVSSKVPYTSSMYCSSSRSTALAASRASSV